MYADDTTLYCNINQDIGEEVINGELLKLWEWLGANKLSLNIAKTKYMVFHTSKRNVIYPNLKFNNNNIERVTQFNFLGVILHSHMTWNKHINHISMKIAKSIGILYRLRNVYPESILITIYNTLILPHFHYCLLLWASVGACPGIRKGGGPKSQFLRGGPAQKIDEKIIFSTKKVAKY